MPVVYQPGFGEQVSGQQYFGSEPGGSAIPYQSYLDLVTSQYRGSENMLAWLGVNLQLCEDLGQCISSLTPAFDIDAAVGKQLDVLGVIIGQSRAVRFQPSGGISPVLDDNTYRMLLRARVYQNHWEGTMDSLFDIWQTLFPGGRLIFIDHQDMTADLYVAAAFTSIIQDLVMQGYIVPKPQAVLYTYHFAELPMFGLDRSDDYVAGLDLGHLI